MDIIINDKQQNGDQYPCLKKMGDTIVLFVSRNEGVALNLTELGDYSICWEEKNFKYFNGDITLKN